MTLRLTDTEAAALRDRAAAEGRSMQEIARTALTEYLERSSKRALLDGVLDSELSRYADALDRLGQ